MGRTRRSRANAADETLPPLTNDGSLVAVGIADFTTFLRVLHPGGWPTAPFTSAPRQPLECINCIFKLLPLMTKFRKNFIHIHN